MPLTPRSAGSYLLFGFCLEKCISTGHSSTRTKKKRGEEMLDCNYQLKNTVLEKEKGNSIISKIMESLKGLNVTTAEFLLEECKKEIYQTEKI